MQNSQCLLCLVSFTVLLSDNDVPAMSMTVHVFPINQPRLDFQQILILRKLPFHTRNQNSKMKYQAGCHSSNTNQSKPRHASHQASNHLNNGATDSSFRYFKSSPSGSPYPRSWCSSQSPDSTNCCQHFNFDNQLQPSYSNHPSMCSHSGWGQPLF